MNTIIDQVNPSAAKKELLENINNKETSKETSNVNLTPITPETNYATGALQPINQPTLQDFISEAQKLGQSKIKAQQDILNQNISETGDALLRKIHGQNVGASSGVGQQIIGRQIGEMSKRLEPIATQVGAELGQQELTYQKQERDRLIAQQDAVRENKFNLMLSGQLDKSQLTEQDWQNLGITDSTAIQTVQQLDISNAMISEGLDPKDPIQVQAYKEKLKNSYKNNLRKEIIGWYMQANDNQLPTETEIQAMMAFYGEGTGLMTDQEIQQYNQIQWNEKMQRARQKVQAEKSKVICTELYHQGILDEETYRNDQIFGKNLDPIIYSGYVYWANPLVKKMKNNKWITKFVAFFAIPWAKEMSYRVSGTGKGNFFGSIIMDVGLTICYIIGKTQRKKVISW